MIYLAERLKRSYTQALLMKKSCGAFLMSGGDSIALQKGRCAGSLLVHDPLENEGGAAHAEDTRSPLRASRLPTAGAVRQEVL